MVGNWYALSVRRAHEAVIERTLTKKGYRTLLPVHYRTKNGIRAQCPLFPGYLFFQMASDTAGAIVTTPGVIRVLGMGKQWTPIPDTEMSTLHVVSASDALRRPWRYLPEGCRVRVTSGPLSGAAGILLEREGALVVSVTLLQRSIAVFLEEHVGLTLVEVPDSSQVLSTDQQLAIALCSASGRQLGGSTSNAEPCSGEMEPAHIPSPQERNGARVPLKVAQAFYAVTDPANKKRL